METTGCGSLIPSLTNIGSSRSDGRTLVCATSRRSAAVRRSLRGRAAGNSAGLSASSACLRYSGALGMRVP